MSKVFYTADTHFRHTFVAGLRGYASSDEHDAALIDRWNSAINKRDIVWVLGDVSQGSVNAVIPILEQLHGAKHLVAGNHDGAHPMHRDSHRSQRNFLRVFESVQTAVKHKINGQDFLLSHFPYQSDEGEIGVSHEQWRLPDKGVPLLCGHVHTAWKFKGYQLNVGVDQFPSLITANEVADLFNGSYFQEIDD